MDNEVGVDVEAAQNPVVDEVSESNIPSDLPGLKEHEGYEVYEEADEDILDDGSEPLKEDSNDNSVPSVSSHVHGLQDLHHDDEVMEDAVEEHSSDESNASGVSTVARDDKGGTDHEGLPVDNDENGREELNLAAFSENQAKVVPEPLSVEDTETSEVEVHQGVEEKPISMVMAKEKLEVADTEEMSHDGTDALQSRTTDEILEEIQRSGHDFSTAPAYEIFEEMHRLGHEFASTVVPQQEETSDDVSSAEQNHTHEGFKDGLAGDEKNSAVPASDAPNQSKKTSIGQPQMDSVNNHSSCNSAEVNINGVEGEAADQGKQTSHVSREIETKSANPALPPIRRAGLGRAAPLLEHAPRVQQPRHNGSESLVQQSQVVEEEGNGEIEEGDETREKLQKIRVKFLRLAHRLGQTPHNVVVAQVL